MTTGDRPILQLGDRLFVHVSAHPLEERIVELTADYRNADGTLLLPELLAWDGVQTCPDVVVSASDDPDDLR
jgi:hypothetical protein